MTHQPDGRANASKYLKPPILWAGLAAVAFTVVAPITVYVLSESAQHEELVRQVVEDMQDCIRQAAPKTVGDSQVSPKAQCVVQEGELLTKEFGTEKAAELVTAALEKMR